MITPTPSEILDQALRRAVSNLTAPLIGNADVISKIELVSRNLQNRAVVRLVLACALAKVHNPAVDICKPYTQIGTVDAFSGRGYDEQFAEPFVLKHNLPCNPTTAFLTPALRNRNAVLLPDTKLEGRSASVYAAALQLLTDVQVGEVNADDLLAEVIRQLLLVREERRQRLNSKMADLRATAEATLLAAEDIVNLIEQHLRLPGTSRLPVLIVNAAYAAAEGQLGEHTLPLAAHTAADRQTGAVGDVEVTLIGDDKIVTGYEMKMRAVTRGDIDKALEKLAERGLQNYIFITTFAISAEVRDYAASLYQQTGIEVAVLDCITFLRYFLQLFYRQRSRFVEAYQSLLLAEPDSAVSQPLKEAWLSLRIAAESDLAKPEEIS